MTVAEFIEELRKLPVDAEIAVMTVTAFARPPALVRANEWAWSGGDASFAGGLRTPENAYLVRPEREPV